MSLQKECLPLYKVEQLLDWQCDESVPNTPLEEHFFFEGTKVIVCHDMKGGYLEDRFIDGCNNCDAYRFFHWPLIDIFIYFSHYLVTIPPKPWIDSSHINGVQILGTFIIESIDNLNKILIDDETAKKTCQSLIKISKTLGFDGWLLNIEVPIPSNLIHRLLYFVTSLKTIAQNQLIIWYDSVCFPSGKLEWQNELNENNLPFFNVSSAIYLNYIWNDKTLLRTKELATKLNRVNDVFVGVDVFGRKMFGDGKMNTKSAIDKIRLYNLPIAIFAPGWVHEELGAENFTENNIKFWNSLNLPIRHVPNKLPYISRFCQGFGHHYFQNGAILKGPWFNLSLSSRITRVYNLNEIETKDAFYGGTCLLLSPFSKPLIYCRFNVPLNGIYIEVTLKKDSNIETMLAITYLLSRDTDIIHKKTVINERNGWSTEFFEILKIGIVTSISVIVKSLGLENFPQVLIGQIMIRER